MAFDLKKNSDGRVFLSSQKWYYIHRNSINTECQGSIYNTKKYCVQLLILERLVSTPRLLRPPASGLTSCDDVARRRCPPRAGLHRDLALQNTPEP